MLRHSLWPTARNLSPKWPTTAIPSGMRHVAYESRTDSSSRAHDPEMAWSGRAQLRQLKINGVGLPSELTRLQASRNPFVSFRASPRHCLRFIDLQWFGEPGHSKGYLIKERCFDQEKARLLWKATMVTGPERPIIRGKAKARINMAFLHALRNHGYDANGKRLVRSSLERIPPDHRPRPNRDGRDAWRQDVVDLYGTLQIHSGAALDVVNMAFTKLRTFCESAVRAMEESMGRNADGRLASRSRGSSSREISMSNNSFSDRPRSQPSRRERAATGMRRPGTNLSSSSSSFSDRPLSQPSIRKTDAPDTNRPARPAAKLMREPTPAPPSPHHRPANKPKEW